MRQPGKEAHEEHRRTPHRQPRVAFAITTLLVSTAIGALGYIASQRSTASVHTSVAGPPTTHDTATLPSTQTASVVADGQSIDQVAAPTVILYGDSLGSESQTFFQNELAAAGITDVHTETFGGTALCDWFDEMRTDASVLHPTTVVIEFSGNALTPCMHDSNDTPLVGNAYYMKYLEDAREALAIFAPTHARVYFVGTPLSQHTAEIHEPNAGRLNDLYASLGSSDVIRYVDAGAAVLDRGSWTQTLPCLPDEPCTGGADATGSQVSVVRAPDGVHFCPAAPAAINGVTGDCPVWSSGAFRFGTAMAAPVIQDLRPQLLSAT